MTTTRTGLKGTVQKIRHTNTLASTNCWMTIGAVKGGRFEANCYGGRFKTGQFVTFDIDTYGLVHNIKKVPSSKDSRGIAKGTRRI